MRRSTCGRKPISSANLDNARGIIKVRRLETNGRKNSYTIVIKVTEIAVDKPCITEKTPL